MLDWLRWLCWLLAALLLASTLTVTFYSYLTLLPMELASSLSLCMPMVPSSFQSSSKSNK